MNNKCFLLLYTVCYVMFFLRICVFTNSKLFSTIYLKVYVLYIQYDYTLIYHVFHVSQAPLNSNS